MKSTRRLDRRSLLRGAGAALALPLLEAMLPRSGFGAIRPDRPRRARRLAVLYMPNGVNEKAWQCGGTGGALELSPTLEPLRPVRSHVVVLEGLCNRNSFGGDGHYVKTAGFLTGTTIARTTGRDLDAGNTSMDQVAAQRAGVATWLPSLELSLEPVTSGIDVNVSYTRLYGSFLSWSAPRRPCPREIDPRRAFDRVFRIAAPAERIAAGSVLDLVAGDADRLRGRVGTGDRARLDEYLESVRAVEKRIRRQDECARAAGAASPSRRYAQDELSAAIDSHLREREGDWTERAELMLEIMALAFQTDVTRVATLMLGNAVTNRSFAFLPGVTGGFHETSHHEGDAAKLDQYHRINAWHVARFASLLARLGQMDDGGESVLDHSMVLLGAGFRDGNAHDPHDLPLVLGGRGGGTIATAPEGRRLVSKRDTPLCNLHLSLLRAMGVAIDSFADSTGELAGLAG